MPYKNLEQGHDQLARQGVIASFFFLVYPNADWQEVSPLFFFKLVVKAVALPLILAMTLIQWVGEFLLGLSSVIFSLIAGLVLLVAGLAFLLGVSNGQEALIMALTGFLFFLIPQLGSVVVDIISAANDGLRRLIKS